MIKYKTWTVVTLVAALLACGKLEGGRSTSRSAVIDGTTPIGAKYEALGGEAVLGAPTTEVVALPNGDTYQRFTSGVIVVSVDWGAVLLSTPIFDKWLSLETSQTATGQTVFSYIGSPIADYVTSSDVQSADFERGLIVAPLSGTAHAVYGWISSAYRAARASLGLPTAEEVSAAGGGRMQSFEHGDIYWRWDSGAHAVIGAIRDRWIEEGGATGQLGYPISDERAIVNGGIPVGRESRFRGGAIFYNGTTGATAPVYGRLQLAYETTYAGATGWLGFPLASGTTAAGTEWTDFEHGMLVWRSGDPDPWAFQGLQLYWSYMDSGGWDCYGICGSNDLYLKAWWGTPSGPGYVRIPSSGDCGNSCGIDQLWTMVPVVSHDWYLSLHVKLYDRDTFSSDDVLAEFWNSYNVDNLFGILDETMHRGSQARAEWSLRNPIPYDTSDFVRTLGWRFHNFTTTELTYDQFAQTFTDVGPDETWLFNPFNHAFYELIYKGIADGGNCFGMSLTSVYAQINALDWAEPIYRFPASNAIVNQINVKQGYQLGADAVYWFVDQIEAGLTHDPKRVFDASQLYYQMGTYPVLSLTTDYFGGGAHGVRPYKWEKFADEWKIWIYDNNFEGQSTQYISINPHDNTFHYNEYSGSEWTGGRMFNYPLYVLGDQRTTNLVDVLWMLLSTHVFVIIGDTGQVQQIADAQGRTFYDPSLSVPATRWDQLRQDDAGRVPDLARLVLSDGTGPQPEMYYARNTTGATQRYTVRLAPGKPEGTPYEWFFNSATLSARYTIPGTPAAPDIIEARDIGTAGKVVSVEIPANGKAKAVSLALAGAAKNHFFDLKNVAMDPGQKIGVGLVEGGYKLRFENNGRRTTAELTINTGPGEPAVSVGTIAIPGGVSEVQFRNPDTLITLTGGQLGDDDWYVAPPTVTLNAVDYSGRGIKWIEYRVEQGDWQRYTNPFSYAHEGPTVLGYHAQDKAGNLEVEKTKELKVDTRAPSVTAYVDQTRYSRTEPFIVHFSSDDPSPGSGLASVTALLDGTPVVDGQTVDLLWSGLGSHTLAVTAKDKAGWTTEKSVTFQLVVTVESVQSEIQALRARGEIDSDGVAQSLLAKLGRGWSQADGTTRAHLLRALESEVRAQRGKHVTIRAADLLLMDIRALMQRLD